MNGKLKRTVALCLVQANYAAQREKPTAAGNSNDAGCACKLASRLVQSDHGSFVY